MASALASPPPPFSGGSADLKANARRFLERALVISALVHLAAVGVFRAALERFAATEEKVITVHPRWSPPVIFTPRIVPIPWDWRPRTVPPTKGGVFLPVPKPAYPSPIDRGPGDSRYDPVPADPHGGDPKPGPGREGPPNQEPPPFVPAADTPPLPIVAPRPAYPQWAREAGIEGRVLVRVLVGTDGIPKSAVIVSGPKGLIEGVVDAVLRWKFKPGLANKEAVEVWVEIPITFRLGE